ncbi:hypothetical protein [Altererythrobacter sp. ZODW24]|uniref:hypothetical protein n=1 Tax=Altererythrobacter sp. ZODW24 TaxID=2185142 RepID=UPI000DF723D9|nr:hypothetical protein [Altererythrobacter sp. ZODW24]
MDLVFPFILIIVGWHPDSPDQSMVLQSSLQSSHAVCEAAGQKFMDEREAMKSEIWKADYKYWCIAAPGPDEHNGAAERNK